MGFPFLSSSGLPFKHFPLCFLPFWFSTLLVFNLTLLLLHLFFCKIIRRKNWSFFPLFSATYPYNSSQRALNLRRYLLIRMNLKLRRGRFSSWNAKTVLLLFFFFQVKIYSINCKIKKKIKKSERKAKMLFVRMSWCHLWLKDSMKESALSMFVHTSFFFFFSILFVLFFYISEIA